MQNQINFTHDKFGCRIFSAHLYNQFRRRYGVEYALGIALSPDGKKHFGVDASVDALLWTIEMGRISTRNLVILQTLTGAKVRAPLEGAAFDCAEIDMHSMASYKTALFRRLDGMKEA